MNTPMAVAGAVGLVGRALRRYRFHSQHEPFAILSELPAGAAGLSPRCIMVIRILIQE
jgi:hypothetical protein